MFSSLCLGRNAILAALSFLVEAEFSCHSFFASFVIQEIVVLGERGGTKVQGNQDLTILLWLDKMAKIFKR